MPDSLPPGHPCHFAKEFLDDPFVKNGVELYWDRPKEQWPTDPDGTLAMFSRSLDLHDLLRDAGIDETIMDAEQPPLDL